MSTTMVEMLMNFCWIAYFLISAPQTFGYNCTMDRKGDAVTKSEENLKCYLLSNLNQQTRPTWADTNVTNINISSGYMNLTWLDQELAWNPDKHHGQYFLNTTDLVWIPGIQLTNQAFAYGEVLGPGNTTTSNRGVTSHVAPFSIRSRCKIAPNSRFLNAYTCQVDFIVDVFHPHITFSNLNHSDIISPWIITKTQTIYPLESDDTDTESVSVMVELKRNISPSTFCGEFASNSSEKLICKLFSNYKYPSDIQISKRYDRHHTNTLDFKFFYANVRGHHTNTLDFKFFYANVHVSGMLQLIGDLEASWQDPQLTWEPSKHNNTYFLNIQNYSHQIWKPHYEPFNHVFPDKTPLLSLGHVTTVSHEGLVTLWAKSISIQTTCKVSKHAPWNHQRCDIKYSTGHYVLTECHMQTATESPWIAHIYGWSDGMHNGKHFTTLPIKLERNDSHFKSKRCILFADSNEEELECYLLSKTNITKPSSGTFLLGPQIDMMISYADLNIENGILVTKGELVMNWEDERMVWDPKKFGNQSVLKVEADAMWKPCFVLSNEVFQDSLSNESYVDDLENTTCNSGWVYLKVLSNGNMTWASPMNLETKCNMTSNSWPWNHQTCHLNFTFNTLDVTLKLSQKIDLSGTLWRITKITRKHTTQNDFRCTVEITLKMKSNLLQVIMCFLFTGVSLVTLSSFLISPLNRTKPVSKASSLLLLVIFLVILMNSIPHFTTHASNFVVGYVVLLLMVGISGCITAYYVRLARKLLSYNAFLDMKISHPEDNKYENDTMKTGLIETITSADDESSNKSENEWLKVARIIEYSSFTISLIVVVLLMRSLMS